MFGNDTEVIMALFSAHKYFVSEKFSLYICTTLVPEPYILLFLKVHTISIFGLNPNVIFVVLEVLVVISPSTTLLKGIRLPSAPK